MGYDIGASVGITGEAEFKRSLQSIKDEFKVLGSEMKLAASQFDKNDKSAAALTATNKVLGKEIDAQKGKVSLLSGEYDKQNAALMGLKSKLDETKRAFGEGSDEVKKAQREYDLQNTAVSRLKTELNGATADLNKMERQFGANSEAIKKANTSFDELSGTINNKMNRAFDGLKNAAKAAGAAIASGFTAVITSGVTGTMEAENAAAQLEAVLVSTGSAAGMTKEELIALGDSMEKMTKFSSESVQAGEAILLTFTGIGKETFPGAIKAATDMAQALGTDVSSQAMQLGKALNDPVAGISKLTKVGVVFTEEQKAQVKAMAEAGDVAGAQKVILAELNKEFGGSAVAAGQTLSGKLEILKNAFGAVSETLVASLMPYLSKFMEWVSGNMPEIQEKVTKAFDGISKVISTYVIPVLAFLYDHIGTIKNVALGLVGVLFTWKAATLISTAVQEAQNVVLIASALANGGLTAATTALSAATGGKAAATLLASGALIGHNIALAAGAVAHGVAAAATGVATAAQWLFNAALTANPIGIVIVLIGALIAAVVLIATHWKEVTKVLTEAWKKVEKVFEPVAKWFGDIFEGAWKKIKSVFSAVGSFFTGVWNTITSIFKKIGTAIGEGIGGAFKAVVNAIIGFAERTINGFIRSINFAISLINKIPGVEIPKLKELDIPRMEVGTRYLPADMLIYAHKGEMIVPRSENPYANSGRGRTLPHDGSEEIIELLKQILKRTGTGAVLYKRQLVGALAPDLNEEFARLERRK
jgi:phage-related protein